MQAAVGGPRAAADGGKKQEKAQKANFEGLQDSWKRITAEATKRGGNTAAAKTAEATDKTARSTETMARTAESSNKTLTDIFHLLAEIKDELPLVGAFGA